MAQIPNLDNAPLNLTSLRCFEYIEELIHKQEPLVNVLCLLILFSITSSGIPKSTIFTYVLFWMRELLHSYGFEHMATLNNLEKTGLLRKKICPNDIAYVFSGYAPLSICLVQHAVRSGWRPIEEILKLLPGPHSETKRGRFSSIADGRRSLVLVVFIGGITFAEISALRFLSVQEGMAYDLIVGTTKIVSGHSLAETFVERLG
ncbi:hypothetical protein RGQ29_028699 [Quercus rubra]|uniref:Uncharacterized protein n=1 Tax=Quercus rubra TaxID=3512 RepID=A0AAN7ETT4_QUERU|nr:hypothetical protein RGQ29_028699 [Quercus rubra]